MKKLLLPVFLSLFLIPASATHVAGGDISYRFDGNSNFPHRYEITLTLIRDTRSSATISPVIHYTNVCGLNSGSLNLVLEPGTGVGISTWAQANGFISPYNCVDMVGLDSNLFEIWIYKGTVNLNGTCPEWRFYYSLCCLSGSVENLVNPSSKAFYIEATLNNMKGSNNAPVFIDPPLKSFCLSSKTINWNQRAVDSDGDSLYYKFITPKWDYNAPISYLPGYSVNNQMTSNPPMLMNPKSGLISVSPAKVENVIISLSIEEYKLDSVSGGYFLAGSVERYMQIPVVANCALVGDFTLTSNPDSTNNFVRANCGSSKVEIFTNDYYDPTTIAPDASDFALYHGNHLIPLIGINLGSGLSGDKIELHLRDTISFNDTLYLRVMMGNDLNTISNECGKEMRAGDSLMVVFQGCSGISLAERIKQSSSIYPNPSSEFVNVSLVDYYDKVSIELRNYSGKLISERTLDPQLTEHLIDLSKLPSGVYHLRVNFPTSIENHSIIKN